MVSAGSEGALLSGTAGLLLGLKRECPLNLVYVHAQVELSVCVCLYTRVHQHTHACCTPVCFLILGSATPHSTPIHAHCADRVELGLQMPTEGKPWLLVTADGRDWAAENEPVLEQGQGVCSSICPQSCCSHLGRADAHRGQREAGRARGSRPEQAAGRVILKIIQWPIQGAARYVFWFRWPEQSRHLQSHWPRVLGNCFKRANLTRF